MNFLSRRPRFPFRSVAVVAALAVFVPAAAARAHDIGLELDDLEREVRRIRTTIQGVEGRPALPVAPNDPVQQRRALGEAEVEQALGNTERALRILLGRLADPSFRALPEYVDALLLTAEVLEREGEVAGAMALAREAMDRGRSPAQMAEAGARWFRLSRLTHQSADRLRMFELWKAKGGAEAAGTEQAAQVMYEAGFALRDRGQTAEARDLLSKVPSESRFGSRAAFLAGTLFVQDGDLTNGERWFAAIKDWPLPDLPEDHPQLAIERELRDLAALSAARLRYDRGDVDEARLAYQAVGETSRHRRDACWELAFLESEADRERAALKQVACVKRQGAPGVMRVELRLLESSLMAHLSRYGASIEAYEALHADVVAERDLVGESFARIENAAEMLFSGMERMAVEHGREASPGPATLFGGAWTPRLDQAYRVDRGLELTTDELLRLRTEVRQTRERLQASSLDPLELRRLSLERLLREIDHLAGHAGDMAFRVRGSHASAEGGAGHDHRADRASMDTLKKELAVLRERVTARMLDLEREGRERRAEAFAALDALEREIDGLLVETKSVDGEARGPVEAAARKALDGVVARLDDAARRAEVGVLDTYWLKKEHRTRAIESILAEQKETERQLDEALGTPED